MSSAGDAAAAAYGPDRANVRRKGLVAVADLGSQSTLATRCSSGDAQDTSCRSSMASSLAAGTPRTPQPLPTQAGHRFLGSALSPQSSDSPILASVAGSGTAPSTGGLGAGLRVGLAEGSALGASLRMGLADGLVEEQRLSSSSVGFASASGRSSAEGCSRVGLGSAGSLLRAACVATGAAASAAPSESEGRDSVLSASSADRVRGRSYEARTEAVATAWSCSASSVAPGFAAACSRSEAAESWQHEDHTLKPALMQTAQDSLLLAQQQGSLAPCSLDHTFNPVLTQTAQAKGSWAAGLPATDGARMVAFLADSGALGTTSRRRSRLAEVEPL